MEISSGGMSAAVDGRAGTKILSVIGLTWIWKLQLDWSQPTRTSIIGYHNTSAWLQMTMNKYTESGQAIHRKRRTVSSEQNSQKTINAQTGASHPRKISKQARSGRPVQSADTIDRHQKATPLTTTMRSGGCMCHAHAATDSGNWGHTDPSSEDRGRWFSKATRTAP